MVYDWYTTRNKTNDSFVVTLSVSRSRVPRLWDHSLSEVSLSICRIITHICTNLLLCLVFLSCTFTEAESYPIDPFRSDFSTRLSLFLHFIPFLGTLLDPTLKVRRSCRTRDGNSTSVRTTLPPYRVHPSTDLDVLHPPRCTLLRSLRSSGELPET